MRISIPTPLRSYTGEQSEVELAAHVARNLEPMGDEEREALRAKTKPHSPGLEWYKR